MASAKWLEHSSRIRSQASVPRNHMPWTDLGGARGVCGERKLDLVNVAWAMHEAENARLNRPVADLKHNLFVDLAQTILRKPWGVRLRSARQRCQIYSFEYDRCLVGSDLMRICGWPKGLLDGCSESDLMAVATESTSVPLASLIQFTMWSNPFGCWRLKPKPSA